jgi:hypothetical protein
MHEFCEGPFSWGNVVIVESELACGGSHLIYFQIGVRAAGMLSGGCERFLGTHVHLRPENA